MAKHLVKCFYCGETFDASKVPYVKVNSRRYAHQTCSVSEEEQKTQEQKDKEELERYIKQLFKIEKLTVKILKQIETFHVQNNYTYSGIRKSLVYFFEVKGNSIEKANGGIGIVPYVYDDAFRYWQAIWEAKERNENIQLEEFVLPVREVRIEEPQRKPMKQLRRLFTFLDEEGETNEE